MPSECPNVASWQDAGDGSADCFISHEIPLTCESNRERIRFNQLAQQYPKELESIIKFLQMLQSCTQHPGWICLKCFVALRANWLTNVSAWDSERSA